MVRQTPKLKVFMLASSRRIRTPQDKNGNSLLKATSVHRWLVKTALNIYEKLEECCSISLPSLNFSSIWQLLFFISCFTLCCNKGNFYNVMIFDRVITSVAKRRIFAYRRMYRVVLNHLKWRPSPYFHVTHVNVYEYSGHDRSAVDVCWLSIWPRGKSRD